MSDRALSPEAAAASPVSRRELLVGGILAGGAALGWQLRPRSDEGPGWGTMDAELPQVIGEYRNREGAQLILPGTDPIIDQTYSDLLTRLYEAPGKPPVLLLIALGDGGSSGLAVHRPEECYPAAGLALSDSRPAAIGGLPAAGESATLVTASRGEWIEQVYFWVRIGESFPLTGWGQRLATMRYDLSGKRADGALVRLAVVDSDQARARDQLESFNAAMIEALPPRGRRLLLGTA